MTACMPYRPSLSRDSPDHCYSAPPCSDFIEISGSTTHLKARPGLSMFRTRGYGYEDSSGGENRGNQFRLLV